MRCEVPITGVAASQLCLVTSLADGRIITYDFSSPSQSDRGDRGDTLAGLCSLCGSEPESPLHYFLQCPALVRPRQRLLQELETLVPGFRLMARNLQLEIILYGVESHQVALDIRDAVQTFVVKTKT